MCLRVVCCILLVSVCDTDFQTPNVPFNSLAPSLPPAENCLDHPAAAAVQSKGRGGLQSVVNLYFIETALNEDEERIVLQRALEGLFCKERSNSVRGTSPGWGEILQHGLRIIIVLLHDVADVPDAFKSVFEKLVESLECQRVTGCRGLRALPFALVSVCSKRVCSRRFSLQRFSLQRHTEQRCLTSSNRPCV